MLELKEKKKCFEKMDPDTCRSVDKVGSHAKIFNQLCAKTQADKQLLAQLIEIPREQMPCLEHSTKKIHCILEANESK